MAIGSHIIVQNESGNFLMVYNHMSSHPMFSGRILSEYYSDHEAALDLVKQGNIECLGHSTTPIPDDKINDSIYTNGIKHCKFYIRDCGKSIATNMPKEFSNLENAIEFINKKDLHQYTYVFKDDKWFFRKWKHRLEEMTKIRIFHDDEEDG